MPIRKRYSITFRTFRNYCCNVKIGSLSWKVCLKQPVGKDKDLFIPCLEKNCPVIKRLG